MTTHATTRFETAFRRDPPVSRAHAIRRALLLCGAVSSLYYAGMTAYVTAQAEGYSSLSQAVSELSAIDAPTWQLWAVLGIPYTLLLIAFGWGVWLSAGPSRALRAVGALYVAEALIGAFWPPMHLRGAEPTLTDTLHLAWTAGWLVVMLTTMGLAAAVLGRRFRIYTLATLATFVAFGVLTSLDAPRLAAGLPTPYLGLWERINMGAGMLWIAVLAVTLLRREPAVEGAPADVEGESASHRDLRVHPHGA
jgi:hypothetical protein